MANYFLHVKTFARGQGSKVTKAAAYRAGERIRDERTSAVYDHTGRMDVAHAEIVLPSAYADRVDMEWALDRSRLWNAAEHAGRRCNSRLAREVLVHVPPEMTPAQRTSQVSSTYGKGAADTIVENCGNSLILRCSASEQGGTSQFASRLMPRKGAGMQGEASSLANGYGTELSLCPAAGIG